MSTEALRWAFRLRSFGGHELAPPEKAVLLTLADHADEAHECFPSVGRIAAFTNLRRRGIQYILRRLEGLDPRDPRRLRLIETVDGGGGRGSARYRLAVGEGEGWDLPIRKRDAGVGMILPHRSGPP